MNLRDLSDRISYSDKYSDDIYEYRSVASHPPPPPPPPPPACPSLLEMELLDLILSLSAWRSD